MRSLLPVLALCLLAACSGDPRFSGMLARFDAAPDTEIPDAMVISDAGEQRSLDGGGEHDGALVDGASEGGLGSSEDRDASARDGSGADAQDATGDSDDGGVCRGQESPVTLHGTSAVDLVIAFDTSLSMAASVCNVFTNLAALAEESPENTHIVAVYEMGPLASAAISACGESDPFAGTSLVSESSRYLHIPAPIDSKDALAVLIAQYPNYDQFLRGDAETHFLVVSDDNSLALTATQFQEQMATLHSRDFIVHGALALDSSCPTVGAIGTEYVSLIEATDGIATSLCDAGWGASFADLAAPDGTSCHFRPPQADPELLRVHFKPEGGQPVELPRAASAQACVDLLGWYQDGADIALCSKACELAATPGLLSVELGCSPEDL